MTDDPVFAALEAVVSAASGQATNPARIRALVEYRMSEVRTLGRRRPSPAIDALVRLLEVVRSVADRLDVGDVESAEFELVEALAGIEVVT